MNLKLPGAEGGEDKEEILKEFETFILNFLFLIKRKSPIYLFMFHIQFQYNDEGGEEFITCQLIEVMQ